jgi:hypothetical protein
MLAEVFYTKSRLELEQSRVAVFYCLRQGGQPRLVCKKFGGRMSKITASDETTAPKCESIVGQTDQAGLERLQKAATKFIDIISVHRISEATFIKELNCHSQRRSNSPALPIPTNSHILADGQIPYQISWTGEKPDELADFWGEVEKL